MQNKEMETPSYYNKNGLSPLEAYEKGLLSSEENIGFIKGNIIKYVIRYADKNGVSDLMKAKHYLEILIGLEKKRVKQNDWKI